MAKVVARRVQFAIPGLCIETHEGLNYLCLHFVIRQPELTAHFALPGTGQVARTHHSLSQRIHTVFPRDRVHERWPHPDGKSSCGKSDGEVDLGLEDGDWENLPPSPIPIVVPTGVLCTSREEFSARAILQSSTAPKMSLLPAAIWNEQWYSDTHTIYDNYREDSLFLAATNGTPSRSVIYVGESVAEAADQLLEAIGRCVDDGDFTSVLSNDQTAIIFAPGSQ
ncbi:hypothetical protein C8R44DRAFT_737212 [Mycena epipterygia]|nr:hypothetical protein C8R44DRAFT_737212 [Mycena epipterygia]